MKNKYLMIITPLLLASTAHATESTDQKSELYLGVGFGTSHLRSVELPANHQLSDIVRPKVTSLFYKNEKIDFDWKKIEDWNKYHIKDKNIFISTDPTPRFLVSASKKLIDNASNGDENPLKEGIISSHKNDDSCSVDKRFFEIYKDANPEIIINKKIFSMNPIPDTLSNTSSNSTSFLFNYTSITHFSGQIGIKTFNQKLLWFGLESQITFFKNQYNNVFKTYPIPKSLTTDIQSNYKVKKIELIASITNVIEVIEADEEPDVPNSITKESKVYIDPKRIELDAIYTTKQTEQNTDNNKNIKLGFEYKKENAFSIDMLFGKRFIMSHNTSFDLFASLGYAFTTFHVKNNGTNHLFTLLSDNSQESSNNIDLEKFFEHSSYQFKKTDTKGVRLGVGLSFNFNEHISLTSQYIYAYLKGADFLSDRLKTQDLNLFISYRF